MMLHAASPAMIACITFKNRRRDRQGREFTQMFNTLKHASTRRALLAATLFATATGAFAQAPTEAQKSAIRSACRSDFMAHCASVTPGGAEAYQCLQKNMSSLSSGCQTAVRAVEPAAAPKTEAAPAKSEPAKTEAAPPPGRSRRRSRSESGGVKAAEQHADCRGQERVPRRLSQGVRQRAAGRRPRPRMPREEQGQGFAGLREGGERRNRWRQRCCDSSTCGRSSCGSSTGGGAGRDRSAPATAARRTVHRALGLRCRHPHALRRRRAGRGPHRAMHLQQCRVTVARLQGSAGAIRGAISGAGLRAKRATTIGRARMNFRAPAATNPLQVTDFDHDKTGRKTCVHFCLLLPRSRLRREHDL